MTTIAGSPLSWSKAPRLRRYHARSNKCAHTVMRVPVGASISMLMPSWGLL
jgi:hypothetical protein